MKRIASIFIAIAVVAVLAIPVAAYAVKAYTGIPTFSIVSVIPDQKVTIETSNFPANYDFNVLIGAYGTLGVGGTQVATTNSGSGGSFQATYTIPDALKGSQQLAIRLESTTGGFYAYNWFWNNSAATAVPSGTATATAVPSGTATATAVPSGYSGYPTFSISSVVVDTSVTIAMVNLPANHKFVVLMGPYGSMGVSGTQIDFFDTGSGGAMSASYNIPDSLKGSQRIAIRIESTTDNYYAYNWFWNNATSSSTTTSYSGIPTISIDSVVVDTSVTISGDNFPANYTFDVLMGAYGTLGVGGTKVTSFDSGSGGTFTSTFNIPASLKGSQRIAIRLESTSGGFYAYNWFWNNTASSGSTTSTSTSTTTYTGIPTISIISVFKDNNVTISAKNFPANVDFVVLMGPYGSLGVGGTQVTTFNSNSGGDFSATYNLPSSVQGMTKIAIRIESTNGIFYAYNWFWNTTA